jgi:hypothetical protein
MDRTADSLRSVVRVLGSTAPANLRRAALAASGCGPIFAKSCRNSITNRYQVGGRRFPGRRGSAWRAAGGSASSSPAAGDAPAASARCSLARRRSTL